MKTPVFCRCILAPFRKFLQPPFLYGAFLQEIGMYITRGFKRTAQMTSNVILQNCFWKHFQTIFLYTVPGSSKGCQMDDKGCLFPPSLRVQTAPELEDAGRCAGRPMIFPQIYRQTCRRKPCSLDHGSGVPAIFQT